MDSLKCISGYKTLSLHVHVFPQVPLQVVDEIQSYFAVAPNRPVNAQQVHILYWKGRFEKPYAGAYVLQKLCGCII